jgi:16S rRNA (cytosine1402-N4)-methyltransferase
VDPAADDLSQLHRPVLLGEVLAHLAGTGLEIPGAVLVDGTVGLGGHAQAVLEAYGEVRLLGLDRDPEALALCGRRLARFGARVRLVKGSYADLADALARAGWPAPRAVLLDVGVSSLQLDAPERGFSFRGGSALPDMRFDATSSEPTAADLVNEASEAELARILFEEGGEPKARAVARALVRERPFHTVERLAEVIRRAALRGKRIDPATRSFQGLRIAVNDELGHLKRGLEAALAALAPGGRLLVTAFHGEERAVKAAFREAARAGRGRSLTKKPIRSSEQEARKNPRARPARLRVFEMAGCEVTGPTVEGGAVGGRGGADEERGSGRRTGR